MVMVTSLFGRLARCFLPGGREPFCSVGVFKFAFHEGGQPRFQNFQGLADAFMIAQCHRLFLVEF